MMLPRIARLTATAADAKPIGEWSVVKVSDPMLVDPAGETYPAGIRRATAWAYRWRPIPTFHQDKSGAP
ncbi:MAG: hypothetical protein QM676_02000 [Novosphingobium sp.]